MENDKFYLTINGKVVEIRRKIKINNIIKYVVESSGGFNYVTKNNFYNIPANMQIVKFK